VARHAGADWRIGSSKSTLLKMINRPKTAGRAGRFCSMARSDTSPVSTESRHCKFYKASKVGRAVPALDGGAQSLWPCRAAGWPADRDGVWWTRLPFDPATDAIANRHELAACARKCRPCCWMDELWTVDAGIATHPPKPGQNHVAGHARPGRLGHFTRTLLGPRTRASVATPLALLAQPGQ
jgi:hypothetical protein